MSDGRFPYTYADDFVRSLGPFSSKGCVLSRAHASKIIEGIAKAIGMPFQELAEKLAVAEQSKTEEDHQRHVERMARALGYA